MRFTETERSTDEFLLTLVSQERLFIKTITEINASKLTQFSLEEKAVKSRYKKIRFEKSLGVLAAFAKAMSKAGLVTAETTMDMIRAFVDVYSSKNRETFTEDSFKTKYNNVDLHSKKELIDALHCMLKAAQFSI